MWRGKRFAGWCDMKEKELIGKIEQWAEERNLIKGSSINKQTLKMLEEFGELCGGVAKGNLDIIKDSIGDCFVVLTIINAQCRNESTEVNAYQSHLLEPTGHFRASSMDESLLRTAAKIGNFANVSTYPDDWDVNSLSNYLFLISKMANLDFWDCVRHAYEQIKDRKGKMIDGVFVKEEDFNKE